MVNVRLRKETRLFQVFLTFGILLLAVGCSDEKPLALSTANAATPAPAPAPASPALPIRPSDARDSALLVTGPIIVEHQLDLAAQRDGVVTKIFDPELAETHNLKGLRAPNFYVVDMPLSNPEGILKPGMVGVARIYGPRRSVAGLLLAAARRALVRKAW